MNEQPRAGVENGIFCGDCLEVMRAMSAASVDMVFCSPPYEAARTYGIGFKLKGQDWVDWAVERFVECCRVSRGLVAWVVEGQTRDYRYSATPVLLMADLHRAGVNLRKPAIYERDGIPGSGGRDWLKNRFEFVICATPKGRLPWADPKAMGKPCRYPPGGAMSNRHADGKRRNAKTGRRLMKRAKLNSDSGGGVTTDGTYSWSYTPPDIANPGNIVKCGPAGGGRIGSKLAHENEAPFPEALAEFFIRSFCPPGGTVLDPFCGSGTTLAVAERHGRKWIGIDCRQKMVDLSGRRIAEVRHLPVLPTNPPG